MKILIDSSTLYSAFVHSGKVSKILDILIEEYRIVLTDYIKEEVNRNIEHKVSDKNKDKALKKFNEFASDCLLIKKERYLENLPEARKLISKKDAPVLACGMLSEIDYLLTSDKEFFEIETSKVKIISTKDIDELLF